MHYVCDQVQFRLGRYNTLFSMIVDGRFELRCRISCLASWHPSPLWQLARWLNRCLPVLTWLAQDKTCHWLPSTIYDSYLQYCIIALMH